MYAELDSLEVELSMLHSFVRELITAVLLLLDFSTR